MVTSEQRKELKRGGKVTNIICHSDTGICFLVTPETVLVHTGLQTLMVQAIVMPGDLWQRRVMKIRERVLRRRVKCINDLCSMMNDTEGGVRLINARLDWYK